MMRATRLIKPLVLLALSLLLAGPLCAQKRQREPLTEKQIDQIAEAGIDPNGRVQLYIKFIGEHMEILSALAKRENSDARNQKISAALEDLTILLDELNSNLDTYTERKADLRKSLKALNPAVAKWQNELRALLPVARFELARKEAIESAQDLHDDAERLLTEQLVYFQDHKDESGQDRWERTTAIRRRAFSLACPGMLFSN
jgi:hypothetical protein